MNDGQVRDRYLLDSDLKRQSILNGEIAEILARRHGVTRSSVITRIAALGLAFDANSSMTAEEAQSCFVDELLSDDPEEKAFHAWVIAALAITTVGVLLFVLFA